MSATCSIQPFGGKRYKKPDNVTASMYVDMADAPAVKQLPVVALSMKARHCGYCFITVNESLAMHYLAVVPP